MNDSFCSSKACYPAVKKHEGVVIYIQKPDQGVVSRGEEDAWDQVECR